MTTTPAPAPQQPDATPTVYVVLAELDDGRYAPVGNYPAASQAAAIRKAAGEAGAGVYVAIPDRSFTPTKVTVETTKTVRLG